MKQLGTFFRIINWEHAGQSVQTVLQNIIYADTTAMLGQRWKSAQNWPIKLITITLEVSKLFTF